MYDYGEYVSPHTLTYSRLSGAAAHNLYPLQYQRAAFDFFMVRQEGGGGRREGGREDEREGGRTRGREVFESKQAATADLPT